MRNLVDWVGNTAHEIGCGVSGGFLTWAYRDNN